MTLRILLKLKKNIFLLIVILIFFTASILTLYSIQNSFAIFSIALVYRQILWYFIGFILISVILLINNDFFSKYIWHIYIIGILSLLGLFFFAEPINNTLRWYTVPYLGTIQPSEFMKIILILITAELLDRFNNRFQSPTIKEEFIFLAKVLLIVAVPSILTFLQPDTGVVVIYVVSVLTILFVGGLRFRWFLILFSFIIVAVISVISLYYTNTDLFIQLLGTDFFLRVERLLDWGLQIGFQLEQGLTAIGMGHLTGHNAFAISLYFPEAQTDFIFAAFANNFGFFGIVFLFIIFLYFFFLLFKIAINNPYYKNHYLIAGFIGMLFYQQIQNIGMTFGLVPLTGITLPFISAGGSSLLSYMIFIGIIINISNEK